VILLLCICFLEVVPFDYGAYGLLLVLAYYYLTSHPLLVAHFILNLAYMVYKGWLIQVYSILPTLILIYWPALYEKLDEVKVKRWIWRSFYPAHLTALAIVAALVGKA